MATALKSPGPGPHAVAATPAARKATPTWRTDPASRCVSRGITNRCLKCKGVTAIMFDRTYRPDCCESGQMNKHCGNVAQGVERWCRHHEGRADFRYAWPATRAASTCPAEQYIPGHIATVSNAAATEVVIFLASLFGLIETFFETFLMSSSGVTLAVTVPLELNTRLLARPPWWAPALRVLPLEKTTNNRVDNRAGLCTMLGRDWQGPERDAEVARAFPCGGPAQPGPEAEAEVGPAGGPARSPRPASGRGHRPGD
jgi:hypothetical protein